MFFFKQNFISINETEVFKANNNEYKAYFLGIYVTS